VIAKVEGKLGRKKEKSSRHRHKPEHRPRQAPERKLTAVLEEDYQDEEHKAHRQLRQIEEAAKKREQKEVE